MILLTLANLIYIFTEAISPAGSRYEFVDVFCYIYRIETFGENQGVTKALFLKLPWLLLLFNPAFPINTVIVRNNCIRSRNHVTSCL
jgi:hypothetical protein